jgi:hypothetical protein
MSTNMPANMPPDKFAAPKKGDNGAITSKSFALEIR